MPLPRYNVLGVGVHAVDYANAVHAITTAAHDQRPFAVTALAVHGLMTGREDRAQRIRLNQLDLVTPDGQPVRWALNWLHRTGLSDRVYGPFLMLEVCEAAAQQGLGVFLYGSDDSTLAALAAGLSARYPALRIVGTRASRFRRAAEPEWQEDVAFFRASGAKIIFCGLGCPRQEAWIHEMRKELSCPLIAVGAAFSFWSGKQTMAPRWMQRAGLEWLFRLSREPGRLWHRYLVYNPWFICALIRQKLFPRSYEESRDEVQPSPLHWS